MRDLIGREATEQVIVAAAPTVGLYGKLPSHGDFLRRRVSDGFVTVWDAWLQDCVTASRTTLGEAWLDVYLTSPAWRFACSAGACGSLPVMGLMVPSVDRVGRYFPFTLVVELPADCNVLTAVRESEHFFVAAERLVLEVLESDPLDFEAFDERVLALRQELAPLERRGIRLDPDEASTLANEGGADHWQIPVGSPPQLTAVFEQLLMHRLSTLYERLAFWWTDGSSIVEPSCLFVSGLPEPDSFVSLLDGSWSTRRWRSVPADIEVGDASSDSDDTVVPGIAPQFRSAAASDVGRVRRINQDSYLERPEVGLWAVADGLGGYSDGEVASRMVCDALADLPPAGFDDMLEAARQRLYEVNTHLHRAATRPDNAVQSGSTVVAVFTRGTRCAILWAGDSRAYRWRDHQLEQLTRDHSVAEEEGDDGGEPTAITRAVGGEPLLALDIHHDRVRPGDRFLLCSDGLSRIVPVEQIRRCLEQEHLRAVVDGLVKATLDAGAPDNVTALVVEAYAEEDDVPVDVQL